MAKWKPVTMTFSQDEAWALGHAYHHRLATRQAKPGDPTLACAVDLLIRLYVAMGGGVSYNAPNPFSIPWVLPVLRKAIADAIQMPALKHRIARLEFDLKLARKPARKPKRQRAKKPQAQVVEPAPALAFPAPRTMAEAAAALDERP